MKSKVEILEAACDIAKVHPFKVKGCYVFGSRVYGTASEQSDWDIILVANAPSYEVEVKDKDFNIHVIVPDVFEKYTRDNHIKAIECLFAPDWARILNFKTDFVYKGPSFRHNISHTVSNSWVKCKKKLDQGDYYIGIKSMFHSLRIADFGIQFAKNREIDFSSSNWIWDELQSKQWELSELTHRFQNLRNERLTEFRKVANKI